MYLGTFMLGPFRMPRVTKCIYNSWSGEVGEIWNLSTPGVHTDVKIKRPVKREAVKSTKETRYSSV